VLGLKQRVDRQLADDLIAALEDADERLLPKPASHPMAALLSEGARAVDKLLALVESGSPRERRDALDGLSQLLLTQAQPHAKDRLRAVLKREPDAELAGLLASALAIAGDERLMFEQLRRLGDDDPAIVASAARLLGFGRFRRAVPALKGLVSPDRFYESRHVIWALGEIGDPDALPALLIALSNAMRVVDCLIAIGKIGELTSVPHVTPLLMLGTAEQKDAAARALSMILDKNRELLRSETSMREALFPFIERELSDLSSAITVSTRFHLLLCLARLGVKLDPARLRTWLGLPVDAVKASTASGKRQTSVFNKPGAAKKLKR
jgi:hypothetical protein